MKATLLTALILMTLTDQAFSQVKQSADCEAKMPMDKNVGMLKKLDGDMKIAELKGIAEKTKDNVVKYFTEYTKKTCSSVTYNFPDLKVNPGESVYFHVPEDLRERGVRFMVLGHRQEPGPDFKEGEWDDNPGLSSVQLHSGDKETWNYWNGPASGKKGAKFAENRTYPELENLYNWSTYGHKDSETDKLSKDPLMVDMMKIQSVGTDQVILSELTLKVDPLKESENKEEIYSTGTKFLPDGKDHKYEFGGGQQFQGTFPGAKAVYPGTIITVPMEAGKKITSVDIACGDSHQDKVRNSDGGWGTQGWAKLSVGIKKPNGTIKWILRSENVPPEGVMIASPDECDETIEPGSQIVITSEDDTTYVMGVHVGYR